MADKSVLVDGVEHAPSPASAWRDALAKYAKLVSLASEGAVTD